MRVAVVDDEVRVVAGGAQWAWQVTVGSLAVPVVWAFAVMSWWAVADAREWWRDRMADYAADHDEEYDAPELPASRPSPGTHMRALTVAVSAGAILAVALTASDAVFAGGMMAHFAVRAGQELRKQLRAMRDRAADRVPTV